MVQLSFQIQFQNSVLACGRYFHFDAPLSRSERTRFDALYSCRFRRKKIITAEKTLYGDYTKIHLRFYTKSADETGKSKLFADFMG